MIVANRSWMSALAFSLVAAGALADETKPESPWCQAVPAGGHPNHFVAADSELPGVDRRGRSLLLDYPATETTIGAPFYAIDRFFDRASSKPLLRRVMNRRGYSDMGQSWGYIFGRTGLSYYPQTEGSGAFFLPFPQGRQPGLPIGFTAYANQQGTASFTLSCASCHTRNMFGRPVLGGSTIHGGVGSALLLLKKMSTLSPREFNIAARPSGAEANTFYDMQVKSSYIHGTESLAVGLENPASFVGLSLAGRAPDAVATRDPRYAYGAYTTPLRSLPSDSKPASLWTVRYKNRFLLDGSMRGDPMLAQLIFNEIGRGADLVRLQSWIERNRGMFRDMGGAVLAMEPPRWTDFMPAESIDLAKAQRGEQHFNQRCADCHGHYEKAWSLTAEKLSAADLLKTTRVVPPAETVAHNVGTDPNRAELMVTLAPQLNRLDIFKKNGFEFTAHPGSYVPPPLVGIWARYPYMHNNAIPNLDELLKPAAERTPIYFVGTADSLARDYDAQAVGFPVGAKTPAAWRIAGRQFDTRRAGLSNRGHDEGIFATGGKSDLTPAERAELIEFLKTL